MLHTDGEINNNVIFEVRMSKNNTLETFCVYHSLVFHVEKAKAAKRRRHKKKSRQPKMLKAYLGCRTYGRMDVTNIKIGQ